MGEGVDKGQYEGSVGGIGDEDCVTPLHCYRIVRRDRRSNRQTSSSSASVAGSSVISSSGSRSRQQEAGSKRRRETHTHAQALTWAQASKTGTRPHDEALRKKGAAVDVDRGWDGGSIGHSSVTSCGLASLADVASEHLASAGRQQRLEEKRR